MLERREAPSILSHGGETVALIDENDSFETTAG
jgi:hypothetical protein